MARMSIYVPDELKGRMDRLTDQVNWSGVAQAAFEIELRLYPEWKENRMTQVLDRLRASKKEQIDDVQHEGFRTGVQWAEEKATYKHLKIVAEVASKNLPAVEDYTKDQISQHLGLKYWDFWEQVGMEEPFGVEENFQHGFINGAKTVWEKVKGDL